MSQLRTRAMLRSLQVILVIALPTHAEESASAALVGRLPANSIEEGQAVSAEIVKLGTDGVREVVRMLVPPGQGDDAKPRFALNGLAFYVTRPGAEAERTMFVGALLAELGQATEVQVKTFLLNLVQMTGKEEAVAPLSGLLADEVLCEPATQALLRINTPGVVPALRKALSTATGANRVTLVRVLGELRAKEAVPAILPYAASDDADLRRVSLFALASIGDPASAEALAKAAQAEAPYDRSYATALYLSFARRLAENGDKAKCAEVCRDLIKTRTAPRENNVVADALTTLIGAVGDRGLGDALAAVDSDSLQLREAALRIAARVPGKAATQRLVAKLKQAPAETKPAVLLALGRRGDRAVLPDVLAALKDGDKGVRLAAIEAAHQLAPDDAVPPLLAMLNTAEADEIAAVQSALVRTPGDKVLSASAAALAKAPPPVRVALLDLLARRGAKSNVETVFAAAGDNEASVRTAAFRALGVLAAAETAPRVIELTLKATEEDERTEAVSAVVQVCGRIADAGAQAAPVLAAIGQNTGEKRALLLAALAQLGGQEALQAAVADTKSEDVAVQDAAFAALAAWKDASAAEPLLDLARSTERTKQHVVALRGYFHLVGLPSGRPPEQTVRMYEDGIAVAKRPDEKRTALGGLAQLKHLAALRAVAKHLDDPELQAEAASAVAQIALPKDEKEQPLRGADMVAALKKAAEVTKDDALRGRITEYLNNLPKPDEANLAQGKPVTTSVAQQGDRSPDKAVDGNSADPNSAWFGAAWPSWLKVDLEQPAKIDSAHVTFYWDGTRSYQYTVDVSLDDKEWKTVADLSNNDKPATSRGVMHTFEPVEARYVRVSILKNSVNEAVHLVELRVFAAGTAPKLASLPQPDAEGFSPLFNGRDLTGWVGSTNGYVVEDGVLVCVKEGGGLLRTEEQYANFHLKFDFKLEPNGNNGVGIRFTEGNPAYSGMEIQILDDSGDQYKTLQPYQYHGSIYGVVPCERGHQKPVGEWNSEEILANGRHVTVLLNGATIVDADLDEVSKEGTLDHQDHPGLKNEKGYIGFLGHGARIEFRNIRLKVL